MENYKRILKDLEVLQIELTLIEDYNEEVYQALQNAIEETEYYIEENE